MASLNNNSNTKDNDNKEDKCKDIKCNNNPCPSYTQRAGKTPINLWECQVLTTGCLKSLPFLL